MGYAVERSSGTVISGNGPSYIPSPHLSVQVFNAQSSFAAVSAASGHLKEGSTVQVAVQPKSMSEFVFGS